MKENIVLIGMPGAGKSTLGVVLAKMLNFRFIDCDLLIQQQRGKTLQELIDELGVEGFLGVENEVLCGIATKRAIIATGGSAVYSEAAMAHLREIATVVYLQVSFEEMARRVGDLAERGVVVRNGDSGDLASLYRERLPLYERHADITLEVSDAHLREAAAELKGILEGQGLLQMPLPPRRSQAFYQWRDEDRTYNMERPISFDMLDCNRNLRPTEALRLFGDVANADFADLGHTHENMIRSGYFFIVTHATCHIVRQPVDEERATVRTWPRKIKGMQVSRNFDLLDADGGAIAYCQMDYLIIDANAGKPIRIKDFPLERLYEVERDVPLTKRQRIKLSDDMAEISRLSPRFSDLDVNGHVNNTHYPTFAFDALPAGLRDRGWTDFQVEFAAELHLGDEVVLYANDVGAAAAAGEWVKVVGAQADGTTNFGCLFKFA